MLPRETILSPDHRYRYLLHRSVGLGVGGAVFVMLNPSTADATQDDPTVRRCIGFARRWQMADLWVLNAYAWRATDPKELRAAADPVGPDNDEWLGVAARPGATLICAWGSHIDVQPGRQDALRTLLAAGRPHVLRLTKRGNPGHPLYLSADLEPTPWRD